MFLIPSAYRLSWIELCELRRLLLRRRLLEGTLNSIDFRRFLLLFRFTSDVEFDCDVIERSTISAGATHCICELAKFVENGDSELRSEASRRRFWASFWEVLES